MKKSALILSSLLIASLAHGKETILAPTEIIPTPVVETTEVTYIEEVTLPEEKTTYNVYLRGGVDGATQYDNTNYLYAGGDAFIDPITDKTDGLGFEVALEITKSISKNVEAGVGIAYQQHSQLKSTISTLANANNSDNNLDTVPQENSDSSEVATNVFSFEPASYDSVPVYVMAKYNFDSFENGITPYLVGKVGYSFNFSDDEVPFTYTRTGQDGTVTAENKAGAMSMDVANGMFLSLGAGFEYKNFFMDIAYQINTGKVDYSGISDIRSDETQDYNYARATLGFGYRFNFDI